MRTPKNFLTSDITFVKSPFYIKYGIPLILITLATLLKIWLFSTIGSPTPFLLYFSVVIITARYFGRSAAILAMLFATLLSYYYFIPPYYGFSLTRDHIIQTVTFMLECSLIIGLSFALTRATTDVQAKERLFKALVEKSSEGIIMINPEGKRTYCSPSVTTILGYTPEEFINFEAWELGHPDELTDIREQFYRLASHPGKTIVVLHRMKHKDGSWAWIESKITNLLYNPHINAMISNFSNVTERILLEKQREDFIGVASHELKTPLTSLKAYTQVLQQRFKKDTDQTSYSIITKIEHQVNRIIMMINDMLDTTKLQAGKLNSDMSEFDFNGLITDITETLQQTSKTHQIKTELMPLKTLKGDRDRISQVVVNLISNAIKYSPQADTVYLTSKLEDGKVVLSVRDEGIGIPQADIDKVFERFYRVDNIKNSYQGLGLGLFICFQIIEQHKGKIGVHSEAGKGSTFWFSLPLS